MDELFEITKDYFKKTDQEKEDIFNDIFLQLEYLIIQSNLNPEMVQIKLNNLQEESVKEELYEVAELYKNLKNKLIETYKDV